MNVPITRDRLDQILAAMKGLTLGVVGDFILDGYWYADMEQSQLSRETPLFPRPVVRETYSPGGAANVAWNLSALGVGGVWAFGVLGSDWRGRILTELLAQASILGTGLLTQADRRTPFYGKVVLTAAGREPQEDARLDFVNTRPLSPETEASLLAAVETALARMDGLIVADYQDTGVVNAAVTRGLLALAAAHAPKPFVVDSRQRAGNFRRLILKANDVEAAGLFFPGRNFAQVSLADLRQAVVQHNRQTGQAMIITRGEQGCLVAVDGECVDLPGVCVPPPVDPAGAGDAFLAAFMAARAGGANAIEAACLANLAAAVTVTQLGVTGAASPAAILSMYEQWLPVFNEHL